MWAILKAEAMCPKDNVSNGVTEYFSPASVNMLPVKQKQPMIDANIMMQTYHETADRVGLDSRTRAEIVDRADLLIARLLLGKVETVVKSMEQAAGEAMKSIIGLFPDELGLLENPWASFVADAQTAASSTGAKAKESDASGLVEYTAEGTTNADRLMAAKMGYKVGCLVAHKDKDDRLFKIISLNDKGTSMRMIDTITGEFADKTVLTVDYRAFLMNYSMRKDIELLENYPDKTIFGSNEFGSSVAMANCILFLEELVDANAEPKVQVRS